MARARKTTAANTETEGPVVAPVTPAAEEQAAPGFTQAPWQDPSPLVFPRQAGAVMLTITGPKRGRRRAGRQFGPEPVAISAADLTEAERLALGADPALKIVVSTS